MLHKLIRGVTIILAIVLIAYIVFLKLPKASVNSKEVVAEMSAVDLYDAFTANEKQAQRLYLGKAVIVNGLIDDIYEDESGAPVIILVSDAGDAVALITLEMSQKNKLEPYKIGDLIKIKAQCSGMIMEVTLSKGLII